jgi:hypothetical protein
MTTAGDLKKVTGEKDKKMRLTQDEKLEIIKFLLDDLELYRAIVTSFSTDKKDLGSKHDFLIDMILSVTYAAREKARFLHTLRHRNKLPALSKDAYELIDFWVRADKAIGEDETNDI